MTPQTSKLIYPSIGRVDSLSKALNILQHKTDSIQLALTKTVIGKEYFDLSKSLGKLERNAMKGIYFSLEKDDNNNEKDAKNFVPFLWALRLAASYNQSEDQKMTSLWVLNVYRKKDIGAGVVKYDKYFSEVKELLNGLKSSDDPETKRQVEEIESECYRQKYASIKVKKNNVKNI
ncbi:hypothetical protein JN11_02906 [Mucilaginibacter frigoritolerans]|uniref:Uncharacterized protein n=1 Tax=Mucilaginibacter frigoritolerans TaxID=652788 RepID=A0A562TZN0_9SPHI|nr:hypothetical protein [Mucilaginibacter frigoritolerans]TWI98718.1 hypothetical protein JN11_02906 [Mucilaginibacter frigoritolerans]